MSAKERLYAYIKVNGIRLYTGEELRKVGVISEWARTLRQLKQDGKIDFEIKNVKDYNILAIN